MEIGLVRVASASRLLSSIPEGEWKEALRSEAGQCWCWDGDVTTERFRHVTLFVIVGGGR